MININSAPNLDVLLLYWNFDDFSNLTVRRLLTPIEANWYIDDSKFVNVEYRWIYIHLVKHVVKLMNDSIKILQYNFFILFF